MQPFADYAPALAELGFTPVPIRPGEKRPASACWQNAHLHPEWLPDWIETQADASVGVLTRGLAVLDIDILDPPLARVVNQWVREHLTERPLLRVGRQPKSAVFCRPPNNEPLPKRTSGVWTDPRGEDCKIEVCGAGQQVVVHGIHPDTRNAYLWPDGDMVSRGVTADALPIVTHEQVQALFDLMDAYCNARHWVRKEGAHVGVMDESDPRDPLPGVTLEHIESALAALPNNNTDYDPWLKVGMAIHHQTEGSTDGFRLWRNWSLQSSKAESEAQDYKRWTSFQVDRNGPVTIATLFRKAEHWGWTRPAELAALRTDPATADDFPALDSTGPETVDDSDWLDIGEGEGEAESVPHRLPEGFHRLPADFDPADIPCRDWIVPGRLLRGHVTMTVGPPGVAKSTLELTRCIAVATGRELLGESVRVAGPVIYLNQEDPFDEIQRRIAGVCLLHGIPYREVCEHLTIYSGYGSPLRVAEVRAGRSTGVRLVRPTRGATRLRELALSTGAVLIYGDPMVGLAEGLEENSNADQEGLMSVMRALATQANSAVSLTHHTGKNKNDSEAHVGMLDAARGASSLVGAVRLGFTVARMSRDTAKKMGLPWEAARRLVRFDDAKSNYSLPDSEATWYYLESVQLPNGESVGAVRSTALEEHLPSGAPSPEGAAAEAQRSFLIELMTPEIAAGGDRYEGSLGALAERWMSHADVGERTAREQLRRLIPEGDPKAAVMVEHDGEYWLVWRTLEGEGRGSRHRVTICRADPDAEAEG